MPDWALGAAIALCIATITTPAGVSGAVFLLPVQVSLLGVPSPAVTPTNLLYNVVATPGALLRFAREGQLWGRLTMLLTLGTLPGVVIGAVVRVEFLSGPQTFLLVISGVLLPLGAWLLLARPSRPQRNSSSAAPGRGVTALALTVGVVGGVYGIGGGSVLGPLLVARGVPVREVAPAALTTTFLTSVAGAVSYAFLGLQGGANIAPEWSLGLALGVGGLAGSYLGARLQPRLPELFLRRLLGFLAAALAVHYLVVAL
jgi:uncharacterized membrane protein YfcA